jgi:hypothetical protein
MTLLIAESSGICECGHLQVHHLAYKDGEEKKTGSCTVNCNCKRYKDQIQESK